MQLNEPVQILSLLILISSSSSVSADCNDIPQVITNVTEKTPNGTVLFAQTKDAATQVSFNITKMALTAKQMALIRDNFFTLEVHNTAFSLIIKQELDLEFFYSEFNNPEPSAIMQIPITFTCGASVQDVFISIAPINEYEPTFDGSPFHLEIPEDKSADASVFTLIDKVSDIDVDSSSNRFFYIHPYGIPGFGAEQYFEIKAVTRGVIYKNGVTMLDYDTMLHKTIQLNVSVADGQPNDPTTKSSNGFVNITVLDVDDQAPYFVYPSCPKPCIAPPYAAMTTPDYKGFLYIQPTTITAKDDDTLGAKLIYSIKSGNEDGMFNMDPATGAIDQTTSVRENGYTDAEFRIVVQVRKDIAKDLSAIAILTVSIQGRETNNTDFPPPMGASTEEKGGSSLLIPVIILGIILALLIAALVVVVVLYRRKQRQLTVTPDGGEKSDPESKKIVDTEHDTTIDEPPSKIQPQTEEEDLGSDKEDFNGKHVFGNKVTLAIGTADFPETNGVPASRLPPLPLRDSATETTEGKKKKRSRRRNKNKEPEIFDGTKQYNMGLEPEFFESTDKSKVKRSQRSYDKKTDPALWIKVPNDQPVGDAD